MRKRTEDLIAEGWSYSHTEYDFPDGSRADAMMFEKDNEQIILRMDMGIQKRGKGGLGIGFQIDLPIIEVRDERGVWRRQEE